MNDENLARIGWAVGAVLLAVLGGGCSALRSTTAPQPSFYSLDAAGGDPPAARPGKIAAATAPTLIVNPTHAASGFDSQRIIFLREEHKLEYFAHSEWVDTPARMLAPLIVAAVEAGGSFHAVLPTPSTAAGDLRLDTEIVRLQHDFSTSPSRVRLTLRAYVTDDATRKVVAQGEFDVAVPTASADPRGGVIAANQVVRQVLGQLTALCDEAAGTWAATRPEALPAGREGRPTR